MSTDTLEGAPETGVHLEVLEMGSALEQVDRASIDVQIATAKKYPRSVDRSLKEALTLATLDEETAASMFYALPRSGKTIQGPSARLAEVMAYSWGNLRVDADVIAEDRTTVTAMGTCFDLEKNVAIRVRVKRRITDKKGVRYNDDMIGVTSNAAISIALRNAVFKVIPAAMVRRVFDAAKQASIGKAGTITHKRQNAVEWFKKSGVTEAQVFALLGVRGMDDIGEDQLIELRGLRTAIQDGETSIEDTFRPAAEPGAADAIGDALRKAGADAPKKVTDAALAVLAELREKARAAAAIDLELEVFVSDAIEVGTDDAVREAKKRLNSAIAAAKKEG